jgi:lipopolysaccharide export LptBFGC system permease protein LptF
MSLALLAAIVVAAALYWRYPWSRQRGRFGIAAIATFVAWILWRVVLQLSNADNLDVDNPLLLGLSAQDVGSGVLAFLLTALAMGLIIERDGPANRVTAIAAIAGALVILVDRFI